jgi:RNA polymerase sigma factor (sigma-70 family)
MGGIESRMAAKVNRRSLDALPFPAGGHILCAMDDWDLVCAYRNGSEDAFSELVKRYLDLVYSAAHRSLDGNAALAEDVVQRTFALFARKSGSMTSDISMVGWLYKTACNISREVMRTESRRRGHETEAMKMQPSSVVPAMTSAWQEIAPLLEQAMCSLPENDRVTVLLRFFERKPFREIGASLGVSEEAAKMRVSRALEKLRGFFNARGISISVSALGAFLWENSVTAAPAALITSLTAGQLASTAIPLSIATKWILMSNLQKAAIVALSILLISITGVHVRKRYIENDSLRFADGALERSSLPFNSAVPATSPLPHSIVDSRLDRALANLRVAITEPWPNRRLPAAQLRQALDDLGPDRKGAVPVLLEYLKAPPGQRSLTAMCSAAFCLELLGTDASSALPELVNLARMGDLAVLNDGTPRLFAALSPDGAVVGDLVKILADPPRMGLEQLGIAINRLVDLNPALADIHRPSIAEILKTDDPQVRLNAATVLARLPGPKEPGTLPVLVNALVMERLRDSKAYDPIQTGDGSTISREGLKMEDDLARLQAVQALGDMGRSAKDALPVLTEFAELISTNNGLQLRDFALAAVGKINPALRDASPALDVALREQERAAELLKKAQAGTASFSELREGLRYENSVGFAAEGLAGHAEARAAIPALVEAIDCFGNSEAVDRLKELDPQILVERVKTKNLRGINDVAQALGELGPAMAEAVPHMRVLLDETTPADAPRAYALDEAIHRIDARQPKLLYKFDDLHEASTALVQAIYAGDKIRSPVYEAYIRDFQDINAVSRGHLLRFVESTKADPALHAIFVKKLIEKNPSLTADLLKH